VLSKENKRKCLHGLFFCALKKNWENKCTCLHDLFLSVWGHVHCTRTRNWLSSRWFLFNFNFNFSLTGTDRTCSSRLSSLKKIASAVRKITVSRHNEGNIKAPPWTPQSDRAEMVGEDSGGPQLGPHDVKRRQSLEQLYV